MLAYGFQGSLLGVRAVKEADRTDDEKDELFRNERHIVLKMAIGKFVEGLSSDQKAAVQAASQAASDAAWGALATRVSGNFKDMRANGITVAETVPSNFLGDLNSAGSNVYSDWLAKVGSTGQDILDAYNSKK